MQLEPGARTVEECGRKRRNQDGIVALFLVPQNRLCSAATDMRQSWQLLVEMRVHLRLFSRRDEPTRRLVGSCLRVTDAEESDDRNGTSWGGSMKIWRRTWWSDHRRRAVAKSLSKAGCGALRPAGAIGRVAAAAAASFAIASRTASGPSTSASHTCRAQFLASPQ